jgi:predicted nucleic acid-binding protein
VLELTPPLLAEAALLARAHGLRAYDAVQLAAALEVSRIYQPSGLGPVTLISADRELNTAALAESLAADDPTTHT